MVRKTNIGKLDKEEIQSIFRITENTCNVHFHLCVLVSLFTKAKCTYTDVPNI